MHVQQMIATHPGAKGRTHDAIVHCIEECLDCAQACTACADACLGEKTVAQLTQCIRLDLDCADLCAAAAAMASRRTGNNQAVMRMTLEACIEACRLCGEECARHAGEHEHCRHCMETCQNCERVCRAALDAMKPGVH
ncbi:four-helix bundle copper-binding protein [Ferrovibrio sp.]|uniref:four-helix bundle copper-binding protein n=1 Tax=Ferrovibrio sp. TaxID=1917215 RepID=UPI002ED09887